MTEATDDSYIFATKLPTLTRFCLGMERFQFAYGWITQWLKTKLFVLSATGQIPDWLEMESVTLDEGVHPWTISKRRVLVILGELEFLRIKVDNPGTRFQALYDWIQDFKFPRFAIKTPITATKPPQRRAPHRLR